LAIVTFTASQGDVYLNLIKKEDNIFAGDILGMFNVEGKRFKKNQ
jgi:hypothetical protein